MPPIELSNPVVMVAVGLFVVWAVMRVTARSTTLSLNPKFSTRFLQNLDKTAVDAENAKHNQFAGQVLGKIIAGANTDPKP
jgi:hypothetical protein